MSLRRFDMEDVGVGLTQPPKGGKYTNLSTPAVIEAVKVLSHGDDYEETDKNSKSGNFLIVEQMPTAPNCQQVDSVGEPSRARDACIQADVGAAGTVLGRYNPAHRAHLDRHRAPSVPKKKSGRDPTIEDRAGWTVVSCGATRGSQSDKKNGGPRNSRRHLLEKLPSIESSDNETRRQRSKGIGEKEQVGVPQTSPADRRRGLKLLRNVQIRSAAVQRTILVNYFTNLKSKGRRRFKALCKVIGVRIHAEAWKCRRVLIRVQSSLAKTAGYSRRSWKMTDADNEKLGVVTPAARNEKIMIKGAAIWIQRKGEFECGMEQSIFVFPKPSIRIEVLNENEELPDWASDPLSACARPRKK
ncbi:hypothetical protein C8R45DRAFT_924259 [Mycena sanguinolenta]|nr:hypothetical protein C8R45DRAFT_924259 [Mycena sanguinolenta]